MDKDFLKLVGLGMAIGGFIMALNSFDEKFVLAERKGLTLASGIALVGLGATVLTRFEDVEDSARALFG